MPSVEWSQQELTTLSNALRNRGERSLAQLSRDMEAVLGRPYSGIYSKVREIVNLELGQPSQEQPVAEQPNTNTLEPDVSSTDGRFINFITTKINHHRSEAIRYETILEEFQSQVQVH